MIDNVLTLAKIIITHISQQIYGLNLIKIIQKCYKINVK